VRVVVDEPGHHGPAPQVDAPRVRACQPRDVLIGADRDDAVAPNGHGLRDRELVVNGDDLSVRQDRVCGRACRAGALHGGGLLRADSHWLLPTLLIVVSAITNGLFNPANSTAMISMMPREHRGFASAVNHLTFGLGNVMGIALGGLSMSLAFEHYTGIKSASLTTQNPLGFVAALNITFLAAAGLCSAAVAAASARGNGKA